MNAPVDIAPETERHGATLQANYVAFLEMVRRAEACERDGDDLAAAAWIHVAALHACANHCGILASPALERMVMAIGRRLPQAADPVVSPERFDLPSGATVLHVATKVSDIGGLSRYLTRWVAADRTRRHCLALTQQLHGPLPRRLIENVRLSGGDVWLLNREPGSALGRASALRRMCANADIVVLHIGNHDVIPLLALADKERLPPVVYVNHCDHAFWLGTAVSDVVANFREAGRQLCTTRRGIDPRCAAMLPLLVDAVADGPPRAEVRRQLGIDEDAVVLLTVARGMKFDDFRGESFARAHVCLLQRHPRAILLAVGPGDCRDWGGESRRVGGRIRLLPEQRDPERFFRAADIYIDSFPVSSITSLLEAGMHGLPLVSRLPTRRPHDIVGGRVPGIARTLYQAVSTPDYIARLDALIADPRLRRRIGEQTRDDIQRVHLERPWLGELEALYRTAHLSGRRVRRSAIPLAQPNFDEPDTLRAELWPGLDQIALVASSLRLMPLSRRARTIATLLRETGPASLLRAEIVRAMIPDWIVVRMRRLGASVAWPWAGGGGAGRPQRRAGPREHTQSPALGRTEGVDRA